MAISKRVIGIVGETLTALKLHQKGWQIYQPIVDDQIDLVITRYYCKHCKEYSGLFDKPMRNKNRKPILKSNKEKKTFISNLCKKCKKNELIFIVRYLQVKTSEGVPQKAKKPRYPGAKDYSFRAKLRHNVDPRSFYLWVAIMEDEKQEGKKSEDRKPFFYIFRNDEINKFDDTSLPSYQYSDNQKTTLRIDTTNGKVLNKAKKEGRSYDFFNDPKEFFENFDKLEEIIPDIDF